MHLGAGDTVVDLGCGTGLNLPYLYAAVGASDRIVGVGICRRACFEQARRRMRCADWRNIELVEADMSRSALPLRTRGLLATLALATIPDHDEVVARAAAESDNGGRIVNLELQWPAWLARCAAWLGRPAGVTPEIIHHRPADAIERCFEQVDTRSVYFGAAYICSGKRPERRT